MDHKQQIRRFSDEIWTWFAVHKRTLPWRDLKIKDDTQRAYLILVSEVMLQQTQVPRVEVIFKRFLREFPTLKHLADASNKDVIVAWRGMGYNSRALRLRDAATIIMKKFNGVFPREMNELLSIKGIGPYTAAAIRNFAFGIPTPCIDTNIRRILHRVFIGPENPDGTWKKNDQELLKLADEVLTVALLSKKGTTADWHAALMDFGSLICTKNNPKWDLRPLTKAGLMKAAYKVTINKKSRKISSEPGRLVGSTFIPNRIFRGRVIEQLRDESSGLSLDDIGRRVAIDWTPAEHREWLSGILEKLKKDALIKARGKKFVLQD